METSLLGFNVSVNDTDALWSAMLGATIGAIVTAIAMTLLQGWQHRHEQRQRQRIAFAEAVGGDLHRELLSHEPVHDPWEANHGTTQREFNRRFKDAYRPIVIWSKNQQDMTNALEGALAVLSHPFLVAAAIDRADGGPIDDLHEERESSTAALKVHHDFRNASSSLLLKLPSMRERRFRRNLQELVKVAEKELDDLDGREASARRNPG